MYRRHKPRISYAPLSQQRHIILRALHEPVLVGTFHHDPLPCLVLRGVQERSTSGFFSTSSADPPPLTRGRLYKPTLLSATVPPAMTAVPVSPEFEDPQTLADFWAIYAREASQADRRMIANWNKNLDVRLIFSGIFSAILTPFIIESYKLLQSAGASTFFGKGGYRIRVNAMWFGSLIVSLIAALLCIHCKQWLDGYLADTVLHDRHSSLSDLKRACRLRQYRLQGLKRFHVQQIIGLLPVLLYIALLFFAIGLVDFLWHLSQAIAIYISVLCGVVAVFHIATTVTPFFTTRTPFKTPLSNLLGNLWRGMLQGKLVTRGLMEAEELEDVEKQAEILDRRCLKWLMKTTESDAYYGTAQRAGVEFERQQRRFSMSPALPTGARSPKSS
ncbi:hypothetical protein BD779DRAFT_1466914 [Infundibulicybe gibba]|nr:hypothetical protein BD779DRAFT_1466914 [Infundibulicybe gibba]